MQDLRELYQELILDHSKNPRNRRELENPTRQARGVNPLCGDEIDVALRLEGDVISDVGFSGAGCAISTASASMMTEAVKGKTPEEAKRLFERFHALVTGRSGPRVENGLGKLGVFAGVREFPVRVKCATLAWHTLKAALENRQETVSTE